MLAIGKDWWLPTNYAVHGRETDALFQWFFWITTAGFFAVELLLVIFLLRYRRRDSHTKAWHLSGNGKLEFFWTLIPTLILGTLAYGSERVWHNYRSSSDLQDPQRSKILIIGQQFKWNVIYPGPDGKFGRYLMFPKPTDLTWPIGPDGQATSFAGVPGPASLSYSDAVNAIGNYIDSQNQLGKDYADPNGKDDDCVYSPGRRIYVPVNRPVEVQLESMDVIHDFFIPNFRAQLYAVPGMTGRFVFTPTITTAELESASRKSLSIDQLIALLNDPANVDLTIDIDSTCPGAQRDKTGWRYVDSLKKKKPSTIIRDQMEFAPGVAEKLKAAGIMQVKVHRPQPFEIACAQLCGNQHYKMRGEMVVLSQEEFDKKFPSYPHAGPGELH
jgi:heme/copper-type cytochrome/quinol oxidase subunit 2